MDERDILCFLTKMFLSLPSSLTPHMRGLPLIVLSPSTVIFYFVVALAFGVSPLKQTYFSNKVTLVGLGYTKIVDI